MNKKSVNTFHLEHDNNRIISLRDFVNAQQNSLTWYDFLPGDNVRISGDDCSDTAVEIADLLLSEGVEKHVDLIDRLSVKLLNNCPSIKTYKKWESLSFDLSKIMAANLTVSGSRTLRMRVQRLVYYIQSVISEAVAEDIAQLNVSEMILEGNKPWDYHQSSHGVWWIDSNNNNIHWKAYSGEVRHWTSGLPTQIDHYQGDFISIGSIYTNGSMITNGENWTSIEHNAPVVLAFVYADLAYYLDNQGVLWAKKTGESVKKITKRVHFARFFEGVLYVLDNSSFGIITSYSMDTGLVNRFSVLPVQVCNDILLKDNIFYLIDKQQGSIFKFNKEWEYLGHKLAFGRGGGCLLDPVSVKNFNNRLHVVSWLTSRLTSLDFF